MQSATFHRATSAQLRIANHAGRPVRHAWPYVQTKGLRPRPRDYTSCSDSNFSKPHDLRLRSLFLAPLTKDFQDISLALKASEGQDGDEASNIFVKLVKDMSVMQFDDRAPFRVVARSVDGDGEEGDAK